MARPRAIEEGAKRSRELIKQMQEGQQDAQAALEAQINEDLQADQDNDNPPNSQVQTEPDAGKVDVKQAQGQAQKPPEKPADPGQQSQQPANDGDPSQKRIQELEAEVARLAQANTVLRGKLDAEVPRLAAEVRTLKEQLQQQNNPPAGNTEKPAANTETVEKIKKALLEEYPSDVVDHLENLIRTVVQSSAPAQQGHVTEAQFQDMQQQVQQTMGQLRDQRLTNLVPDWKQIQASEQAAWVRFLQHVDPISGRERNDFLQEAWNSHDVDRVAEIFNLYKRERDASKPPPPRDPTPPPPTVPDDRGVRADPNPADPGKKTFKRSYIAQVEAMARRGEFKGREAELNDLRKQFRLAAAQGRVDANA